MKYAAQKERLDHAVKLLNKEEIDLWLIFTSEGSDPCLPIVTGVKTVGPGAFLISKTGNKIAICSLIDAQDIKECTLFDEVKTYQGDLVAVMRETVQELNPHTIVVNYSMNDHFADGLTTGRFRWLQKMLSGVYDNEYKSAEPIVNRIIEMDL